MYDKQLLQIFEQTSVNKRKSKTNYMHKCEKYAITKVNKNNVFTTKMTL